MAQSGVRAVGWSGCVDERAARENEYWFFIRKARSQLRRLQGLLREHGERAKGAGVIRADLFEVRNFVDGIRRAELVMGPGPTKRSPSARLYVRS